jgi:predicted nucleotidyltransferase
MEYASFLASYKRRWAEQARQARERCAGLRETAKELAGICRSFGARRVLLFGSVVRGSVRPGSDLDLAVEGVAPDRFFDLYGTLLTAAGVPLDLVDLDDAPTSLRACIEQQGVPL